MRVFITARLLSTSRASGLQAAASSAEYPVAGGGGSHLWSVVAPLAILSRAEFFRSVVIDSLRTELPWAQLLR